MVPLPAKSWVAVPFGVCKAELVRRLEQARASLRECQLCEWRCGIDRTRGETAPCRLDARTFVFRSYLSLTDEVEIIPTFRVYLAGCNFRCRFCDTAPTCFHPDAGNEVNAEALARELTSVVRGGARTIDLLGGEPSLHPHTLLEIAASAEAPLPLVLDTNLYMTPEVIELLDGLFVWVIGDFKFGNDGCARKLAGISRYWQVVTRNLLHFASKGSPLIVRHLLMPGHHDCCFKPVADWMATHLPGTRFQLGGGYVPCWKSQADRTLGRTIVRAELAEAIDYLEKLDLDWRT